MRIGKGLREYFGTFKEPLIMESESLPNHLLAYMPFLMQIGMDAQKQGGQQLDVLYILDLIVYHGKPKSKLHNRSQALKQNIEHSHPQPLRLHGFPTF